VLGTSGQALVVRTARDGAFSAQPTSPGPWRVRATHPGYAASGEAVVSGSEPPPTLVLRPGGTLEVEVLDAAYDPVEGAVVAVDGPEARKSHVDESSGVIRFERLPAGAYDVSASAPGKLQEELEEVKVEEEREASIRLVLEDAGALGGKVLGLNGLPLAGVVVTARPSGVRSRTDGAGRFDLDGLPPGPVTLVATLPGWKTLRVEENVVAGERFGDLVLHLEKAD